MPRSHFNKKLFLRLFGGFVLTVLAGIFFLNLCVCLAAGHLGYTTIEYHGTSAHIRDSNLLKYRSCDTVHKYLAEIKAHKHFPAEASFSEFSRKMQYNDSFICLSALLPAMLIGTIGFIILLFKRHSIKNREKLSTPHWVLVFLSLFWVPVSTPLVCLLVHTFYKPIIVFRFWDYPSILIFHLPTWVLPVTTGLISWSVLLFVVFRIVPFKQRSTFVLAGASIGVLFFILVKTRLLFPGLI